MSAPLTAAPSGALTGRITVPGDKSISHRALIFGAMARGTTEINGLLEADDVLRTAAALRALGAEVERDGGVYYVTGGRWRAPDRTIYCGNSGTGARLLMGAVAGQGVTAQFDGDRSLRGRPMGRVLDPLAEMGVESQSDDGRLPVTIKGGTVDAITYRLPKPSAQVKSAVLLAGLGAQGQTVIEEPVLSRDHTERMIAAFGGKLEIEAMGEEGRRLVLTGGVELSAASLTVPADPSSAAFPLAAALITEGSSVSISGVLMNKTRTGLFETWREMGANITIANERVSGGEPIADISATFSQLKAVRTPADRAPSMIDEYPILAITAAFAEGTSRFEGLGELKVKESDRLAATAAMLKANGVTCRVGEDWLEVDGASRVAGGGHVTTHDDHRIAMSALVIGGAASSPVIVDDGTMIATSFTGFVDLMNGLGAKIAAES